jgi:hypothetical protein
MNNFFFILSSFLIGLTININCSFEEPDAIPSMNLILALEKTISDKTGIDTLISQIHQEFFALVREQNKLNLQFNDLKDKKLDPMTTKKLIEISTQWQTLETEKNGLVSKHLPKALNYSAIYQKGRHILESAKETTQKAIDFTVETSNKAAEFARHAGTVALEKGKELTQEGLFAKTKQQIIETKDTYLQRLVDWLSKGINKP